MSQEALDLFGRILMNKVRDETIDDWYRIIDGRFKSERAVKVREVLRLFSED